MRDANRQKMYRAEQAVRARLSSGARSGDAAGDVTFESVLQAKTFLSQMREAVGSLETEPERRIDIHEVNKGTHSWHKRNEPQHGESLIELHRGWGMTGVVLTHEYTHHLMYGLLDTHKVPDHGGEFCRLLLDVAELVYDGVGIEVHEMLRDAFDKQRMIYEPAAQRDAARRQILRIRSDIKAADLLGAYKGLPTSKVTYAEDRADYSGATYKLLLHQRVDIDSSYGDVLRFYNPWNHEDVTEVSVAQLRYVEAPMVRGR